MAIWLMGALSFFVGALNTVQSGSNAALGKTLGQPILAALVVTLVNLLTYLAASAVLGIGWPKAPLGAVPWWAWLGGVFGGLYVLCAIFFADKLGAGIFTGLTLTAGIVASVLLDHYGLVGFPQHTANWQRLAGAAIMIAGLAVVCVY